ncbi:MurR/RpiR family transcriptional regulator [Paenibacillus melissococcoides]|uniref:MurR/RpiR family transcriptional regulator n=1 Tax=Paenibacillus melissococcoides TaxID=2912268 RepID=A0ABM9G3B8_9BACL|nr:MULTISPECIES: MurR/RpiR family transcriptional regulator [Paenibacillus]MEB9894916.1 MurR/RpiR family transcriptional regulator [Bacillus cereus]CAH8245832.1 MurR/RpiR family transcriptional regulator [Paenibacillus melissococcoides]CAH8712216.1 MurR/RpiR family transcriptional regulator [Paenibacillus melissococcoides]CAH8712959.1 MurR/RpiR family transcriptional regulator [Paenibacillus melissococcoides]GIO80973.1 putative HTH-type transcriptional regulator [Paenibacillus dendritiformis]
MSIHDNILIKIRDMKDSLTPVERTVAEYVLNNLEEIPHLSIKSLAQLTKTSDASVLRFCKTMGYSGYRSFIVSISASLGSIEDEQKDQYTDIQPGDDLDTIISNISRNNSKSIEDTLCVIDRKEVERAVKALRESRRIVFFGIGASGLVGIDAEQKFSRINKICHAYTDGHSQLTAATLLEKNDVAIFISNSGHTADILDALDIAKKNGACIIAITKYTKSPLAESAHIVLSISTPEITFRSGAMGSRIAMLTVIDILFAGVASAEYKHVKKYLTKTHNILASKHR